MRLRFGDCLLDAEARELRLGGSRRELSPKAFLFLELLLEGRPRAVTKQEIHGRLWPDTFVSDASIARLASEVREAIGDDARQPRLLRTLHRHGYAFSGAVAVEPANSTPRPASCRLVWGERLIPLLEGEIEASAELSDGDEIGVGSVLLPFRAAGSESTTEAGTVR